MSIDIQMKKVWLQLKNKKWLPIVLLLAGALLLETVVCNFSAWKSLFYTDREVFADVRAEGGAETAPGSGEYTVEEGVLTLHVGGVDRKIHNLFFAMEFSENTEIPYTVTLTDEGNYYPYSLPEKVLMPSVGKSYYTNIYPSGRVDGITVEFQVPAGCIVTVAGVCADAKIPFVFSVGRFLILFIILFLIYCAGSRQAGEKLGGIKCSGTKGQMAATVLTVVLLMGLAWKLVHINPVCVISPWPHHKQYQELAEAMRGGRLYLDMEPSQGLVNAENPYDTIYLQANGIDYRADYAYFEGRYYVYFGVVPELLLYLPAYILTGHHMPNYMAVYLFYCGFIVAVFALFYEAVKRWFDKTPFMVYLIVSVLTVLCGNYLFVIARPDLYDTPIMAANMFTVAGIWLWIKGKYAGRARSKGIYFLLGSLCMALVAGCRPQMLMFSVLAIPLFFNEVIRKRELFSKKGIGETVCICVPYAVVAVGIMYYNYARFGSVFDFGATYSLTSNDMTKRTFNLHQALLGIWHYFIKPPVVTSDYPFLQGVQITSDAYMGKLNAEYTYGGLLASNAFLWALLCMNRGKEALKKSGVYAMVLMSMAVSLAIGIADVTGAGILQRYMVDMVWGIWFAAALVILALAERAAKEGKTGRFLTVLAVICLLQAFYGFGVVMGNGDLSVNVRMSNPELYYRIKELFFW